MGFKKAANPRSAFVKIFVTPDEKIAIQAEASSAMLSVSDFGHRRLFGKVAKDRYSYHAINDLSALTQQLKDHYREGGGRHEAELQALLDRVGVAIDKLWELP